MTTLFTGVICKKNLRGVAFLEDLNVVFLAGMTALAAAITPWILVPAAFIEVVCMIVVPGTSWYEKRMETLQRPKDLPLLGLMIAGIFIITIFGFGVHRWFPDLLSHSQSWEFGALCWTATFVFYYWYRLGAVAENAFKLAAILVLMLLPGLTGAAGLFLWLDKHDTAPNRYHFLHVICVAMIGVVLLGTDLMLDRHSARPRQKRQLYESAWVADVPIVAAFVVLIGFAALHSTADCRDKNCPDLLLSGAATFQLTASNVLFSWKAC